MKIARLAIQSLAVALTAAGCGGGTGGTGATSSGPVVSQGVITAKGSIFVNGVEYSTAGAAITVDDKPSVENDLKVGMVVKVRGTSDDFTRAGTAMQVEARDILEGQIEHVDAAN